jgi:hypothetical protein
MIGTAITLITLVTSSTDAWPAGHQAPPVRFKGKIDGRASTQLRPQD